VLPDEVLAEWDAYIEEQFGDPDYRLKVAGHRLADAGWSKFEAVNLLAFAYNAGYDEGYTTGSEDGYDEGRADAELEATS
jgi:hypothetical protein